LALKKAAKKAPAKKAAKKTPAKKVGDSLMYIGSYIAKKAPAKKAAAKKAPAKAAAKKAAKKVAAKKVPAVGRRQTLAQRNNGPLAF
jgi:hypothetical protein